MREPCFRTSSVLAGAVGMCASHASALGKVGEVAAIQPRLIIGVGNLFRGDYAVGLMVAQHLRLCLNIPIYEATGEGAALLECWRDAAQVWLIDALASGAAPGTIYRLEAHAEPLSVTFFRHSTHALGLAEAVELGRVLEQLPSRLIIYGIEGANYTVGTDLSPAVAAAVPEVVARIVAEIDTQPTADQVGTPCS